MAILSKTEPFLGLSHIAVVLCGALVVSCSPVKYREKNLGDIDFRETVSGSARISKSGAHVVFARKKADSFEVVYDGVGSGAVPGLIPESLQISSDGLKYMYAIKSGGRQSLVVGGKTIISGYSLRDAKFTEDASTACIVSPNPGKECACLDGELVQCGKSIENFESKNGRWICTWSNGSASFVSLDDGRKLGPFSSSSNTEISQSRISFIGFKGKRPDLHVLEGKTLIYENVLAGFPKYSKDGERIAIGTLDSATRKMRVSVGAVQGTNYDEIFASTFSFSEKGYGYWARNQERFYLVVDGKEAGTYESCGVSTPVFAKNSPNYAFVAKEGGVWKAFFGDIASRDFDSLTPPIVSDNGKHFAVVGFSKKKATVLLDGVEIGSYDGILDGTLSFDSDGKKLAYAVNDAGRAFVVDYNGRQSEKYDSIENFYSYPERSKLVWIARRGTRRLLVADGKEISNFDFVIAPNSQPIQLRVEEAVSLFAIRGSELKQAFVQIR